MKYGNLNFLELSGPLQACNRTALLFTLSYHQYCRFIWYKDLYFIKKIVIGSVKLEFQTHSPLWNYIEYSALINIIRVKPWMCRQGFAPKLQSAHPVGARYVNGMQKTANHNSALAYLSHIVLHVSASRAYHQVLVFIKLLRKVYRTL